MLKRLSFRVVAGVMGLKKLVAMELAAKNAMDKTVKEAP